MKKSTLRLFIYYLKALKSTIFVIGFIGLIMILCWLVGRLTLSQILLLASLGKEPASIWEYLVFISGFLLQLAPLFGFVEFRTLTPEEKKRIKTSVLSGHIVLIGLGHLGERLAFKLLEKGESVVALTSKVESEGLVEELEKRGCLIFKGNPEDSATLEKLNIEDAKTVVITVDNDLLNVVVAEKVRRMNTNVRVVTRIYRSECDSYA